MSNSKLFTRSITLFTTMSLIIGTGWMLPKDVVARDVRGNTRVNVNQGGNFNRGANINRSTNINQHTNVNRNTNINRNTNVNVNRNVNVHGGGYYNHNHNDGIGVGGAIAIGVAGMAIGSMITAAALPPSCSMVNINGMTYQHCGSSWYQPQYAGSQVNYIVVNPPR
ncbi:hypothetical protein [Methylobacter sp. S3L5C]|uniref:hypothetical protein n=1 Tax=Methylobacter sp. S3L5C TaxID=2839024 RepID=UPI001FAD0D6B|nr:hypothetical protein [Methylobacter sp. S3L5C]UOA08645.1 hypothetical protein KKZ03_21060 [Methylobacter sp. S3L5C]